jgi:hypothetical protein
MTTNTAILQQHLNNMWLDYLNLTPDAKPIHKLFSELNDNIINDHIALRTFNLNKTSIDNIATPFIQQGYQYADSYEFPQKKLLAKYFIHPDSSLPKVFISELITEEFSQEAQDIIANLVEQVDATAVSKLNFCYSGRPWDISLKQYDILNTQSEYASWVGAHGYRPNHFTILVNSLTSHKNLTSLNDFLIKQGFNLNSSGGLIKGTKEQLLEQSSTKAKKIRVQFTDGYKEIPGCYYEFALRYQQNNGDFYQGFVASSADKIFESTSHN